MSVLSTLRVATALSGILVAVPMAFAQAPYDRVVTFGDSLSDNGNLFATSGNPPAPYFNGRFSNGPTWAELISPGGTMNRLGAPPTPVNNGANTNFAFGGARTDTSAPPPGATVPPGIPGIPNQIGTYQLLGGTIGANNLVTLWGGANNLFQTGENVIFTGASAAVAQTNMVTNATAAANDIRTSLTQIIGLGGRTIIVGNLPNLGAAPSFNTSPTASPLMTLGSTTFNTALAGHVQALAAANPGTNLVFMDVDAAFASVIANPGGYGFTNVTQQCLTTVACVTGTPATQNQFLFWDGVHPTAAGHRLLANLATDYLNASTGVSARGDYVLAEYGATERLAWQRASFNRLLERAMPTRRGDKPMDEFYFSVDGAYQNLGRSGARVATETSTGRVRLGFDRWANEALLIGGQVGFSFGSIDAGPLTANPFSFGGDVYAGYRSGIVFANATLGGSITRFSDIARTSLVGPALKSSAVGYAFAAGTEAGVVLGSGGFRFIPSAGLTVVVSNIGERTETGPSARYIYGDRTLTALAGRVALRGEADIKLGDAPGIVFAALAYDDVLSASGTSANVRLASGGGRTSAIDGGTPVGQGFAATLGAAIGLGGSMKLDAAYTLNVTRNGDVGHTGQARVSIPLN